MDATTTLTEDLQHLKLRALGELLCMSSITTTSGTRSRMCPPFLVGELARALQLREAGAPTP